MTKVRSSHKSTAKKVIKSLSVSTVVLCSFALTQYVQAEEISTTQPETNVVTSESSSINAVTPVVADATEIVAAPDAVLDDNSSIAPETTTSATNASAIVAPNLSQETTAVSTATVLTDVTSEVNSSPTITEPSQTIYMERTTVIDVKVPTTGTINWTIENLPEKTYSRQTGQFDGNDVMTVTNEVIGDETIYHIQIDPLFGTDLSLRGKNNIRRTYRNYIGTYTLKGITEDGLTVVTKELIMRPYEAFMTHDEMLNELSNIEQNHASDRLVRVETIGKSALNNDIKMGIVAKDQASLDAYLNSTTPAMLLNPDEALKLLTQGKFDYKLPILINNTHADEQPGIDIVRSLFKTFATASEIIYDTVDANNQALKVTMKISDLLDKLIFLFDFTENPDGDIANTRALDNGLDPNRDTGYQTNPETRAIVEQLNKWNPIAIYDVHGFVSDFLIEPCTPPHDPNFEYDLFDADMVEGARRMGNAGITNSQYDSYIIPKFDYGSGWDDSFSGYTAVYGLYQGMLGHTIEIPAQNQESFKAGFYAVLAGIHYDLENHKSLMEKRLTFYSRGIHKAEVKEAEDMLVTVDGSVKGRIKGDNPKFFPDYYVIPMEVSKNNDVDQAFKMIDYLRRNGVLLKELTSDFGGYKKGDLVIDMAQAKRGFANHVMYKGADESEWPAMYAELVTNFPAMRGFKSAAIFEADKFAGKLGDVTITTAPISQVVPKAPYYVISNNSMVAVKAVNAAIKAGKSIYLTNDGYVVDSATYHDMILHYPLYAEALYQKPVGNALKNLKIYAPGNPNAGLGFTSVSEVTLALREMGFDVVTDSNASDVVVLDSDQFTADDLGKKPTVLLGGYAMWQLEDLGLLNGFDSAMTDEENGYVYEGLIKINLDDKSPYTSGYDAQSLFYSNSGSWIEGIPVGFKSLAAINASDFYVSGWWPSHEGLANKTIAISGMFNGQPMFIYAGNPVNKTHTINFYRWVSNAIYGTDLANFTTIQMPTKPGKPIKPGHTRPNIIGAINRQQHANPHALSQFARSNEIIIVDVSYVTDKNASKTDKTGPKAAKKEVGKKAVQEVSPKKTQKADKAKEKVVVSKAANQSTGKETNSGLWITGLLVLAGGAFVAMSRSKEEK